MHADKPTELSRIKLKTWTRQPVPMISEHSGSPLGPTVSWLSHLALAIYIFVVVNFDALAQASDVQIERRQVVFLCWRQDLNPGPQTPNRQQTECWLTNRLSFRGSSYKLELDSPSLWSASIQSIWPHCQLTFAPGSGDIHICRC